MPLEDMEIKSGIFPGEGIIVVDGKIAAVFAIPYKKRLVHLKRRVIRIS